MAEKQVREIRVVVDTKNAQGLKEVAEGFKRINGSIKETNNLLSRFEKIFFALQGLRFAGFGVTEITNASDSYQKLSDRIKVFEGSQRKANETMRGLARVADNTRSSIEGVATIYSRLALSLNETGLKGDNLLFVTEQLQNSFRLSGSTAAEATAATIQLSQGLASGTLRGQELRSVLEANALIGQFLAESLNTTRGNLMKMAEAGKITSDVFLKALATGSVKLNKDVKNLGVTFQEAVDRGLNKFNVAIGKMNQQFQVSSKFDSFIQGLTNNLGALAAVMVGMAITAIPSLISGLTKLRIALISMASANPALLLFTAIASASTYAYLETDKFLQIVFELRVAFVVAFADISEAIYGVIRGFGYMVSLGQGDFLTRFAENGMKATKMLRDNALKDLGDIRKAAEDIQKGNDAEANIGVKDFEQQLNDFKKALDKMGNLGADTKLKSIQTLIKELNASFEDGKINVESYNSQIVKLSTELYKKKGPIPLAEQLDKLEKENLARLFEYGKIGAEEFRESMNKIEMDQLTAKFERGRITQLEFMKESEKLRNRVYDLNKEMRDVALVEYNKQFSSGAMSIDQYRIATESLAMDELNDKFKSGQMDVAAYNKALVETSNMFQPGAALYIGIQNYISSAGTLSQNVANGITQTFGNLENYMTEFLKNGKFQFKEFANSVIDELNRIIVRSMIIRPLAQGLLSIGGGATAAQPAVSNAGATDSAGSYNNYAAKGAAFDGRASNFFAQGGVVNGRSAFDYGAGKKGVMGEKGPEAIIPLRRDSGGRLGIDSNGSGSNVTVNIINQTDGQVSQKETQDSMGNRTIEVIVHGIVNSGMSSGVYDKALTNSFGMKRKGM